MKRGFALGLCLIMGCSLLRAQNAYRVGMLPQINLNTRLIDSWKLNAKLESRQIFQQGIVGQGEASGYEYALTDLSLVVAHKLYVGSTLAGGYLMRVKEGELIHRFIQQYSFVNDYAAFRMGHRFVADQTLQSNASGLYRFRYRIGLDFALNGQKVDPGEWYLKVTHEYLNVLEAGLYDLEIRLGPVLGHAFTDDNKLEVGLDYRLDAILSGPLRHSLWMRLSWYLRYS